MLKMTEQLDILAKEVFVNEAGVLNKLMLRKCISPLGNRRVFSPIIEKDREHLYAVENYQILHRNSILSPNEGFGFNFS